MSLPFTPDEFLAVFASYNQAVWPAQLVLHAAGVGCLALLAVRGRLASRLISALLALLWAWSGLAYHLGFFAGLNPAAPFFGALFVGAGAVFAWQGAVRGRLRFELGAGPRAALGFALAAYALLGYPFAAMLAGHAYPYMPTFGLPCPTTIFTIGLLAFLRAPYPRHLFAAPLAWAAIALQATFLFGMYEDLALLPAAAAALWLAFEPPHKEHPA